MSDQLAVKVDSILDQLVSHALTLGLFEVVNTSEPKSAPGWGLSYFLWLDTLDPVPERSGLASTSVAMVWMGRIMGSAFAEPIDQVDPNMARAGATLIGEYHGNYSLGGKVAAVDLLGMSTHRLNGQAGFININNRFFRVMTITIPMLVDDVWPQSA